MCVCELKMKSFDCTDSINKYNNQSTLNWDKVKRGREGAKQLSKVNVVVGGMR